MKKRSCAILLSTYNGEKYLKELLDSLLAQRDIEASIVVRDDGSDDNTPMILKEYEKKYSNISVTFGENIGFANSFWWLLQNAGDFDYYAFCDQDDVWLPDKLSRAVAILEKSDRKKPLLYTSNVVPVDDEMELLSKNSFRENRVLDVYESFQRSILPGCTFVFNNIARNIAKIYNGYMEFHDWCLYTIVNVFGIVVFDRKSKIMYRVHEDNVVGQQGDMKDFCIKIKRFFKKSKCTRSKFARDFYTQYKAVMPNRYEEDIKELAYYKEDYECKKGLLMSKKFTGFMFKMLVFFNRV